MRDDVAASWVKRLIYNPHKLTFIEFRTYVDGKHMLRVIVELAFEVSLRLRSYYRMLLLIDRSYAPPMLRLSYPPSIQRF